jgi:hypothetical protein
MSSCLEHPKVEAALRRASLYPPAPDVAELVRSACDHPEIEADGILEITRGGWGNEEQSADDVLIVQTREAVFVIINVPRRWRKPGGMVRVRLRYEWYWDLIEDDELAGAGVMFIANEGHKDFLLTFPTTHERDRMFRCLFAAHHGQFSRWSEFQLDPANYVADFDRYYDELVRDGPACGDELRRWVDERYGEFDITNALGLAVSWRLAELRDQQSGDRYSMRIGMMAGGDIAWRAERHPEARRVYVRLGEQLYDEGLLGPPFDERSSSDEPLSSHDAGPQRLQALMTLAAFANAGQDPRSGEWIAAAQVGIPTVPPSVFTEKVREMWAAISALPPANDDPPAEIPIMQDVDVAALITGDAQESIGPYSLDKLSPTDKALVMSFFEVLGPTQVEGGTPDAQSLIGVCLCGVTVVEELSPLAPPGWRKLILYIVSDLTYDLWQRRKVAEAAGRLAQWVIVTIEKNGWGPDGRSTPLGQHHSYAMGVAGNSGVGMVELDTTSGQYRAPTGDEARRAALAGHF